MNILLTGFMPFGGHDQNVTKILLESFEFHHPSIHVHKVILPTVFDIEKALQKAISDTNPDIIIHLGEHAKAEAITLERVAINIDDARIPDNNGFQPIDIPIVKQGEPAYFSHLPLRQIEKALMDANIPVKMSYSAGTYVCNHLFYVSEYLQSKRKNQIKSGFIHIPLVNLQDHRSAFDLDTLHRALTIIVHTCAK